MIIGIRKWALFVGLATVAAGFLGALIGGWKSTPDCNDAVALIGHDDHQLINCNPGERMEIERQGTVVLARCYCPSVKR